MLNRSNLHGYQIYCTDYIKTHTEAALLVDMGLGKTVITLTAIKDLMFDSFEVHRVLVVCPLRVAEVWKVEVLGWEHLSDLRLSVVTGSARERMRAMETDADIYVINRENLQWLTDSSGIKPFWDMVVIDELSSFKSHTSRRFKAMMKLRPSITRIVGLTGTPTSNGLMDLWAEYRILDMGKRLGQFISRYRREFFEEIWIGAYIRGYQPCSWAEDVIFKRIGDMTVSMKAIDHLDMPSLISNEVVVKMDDSEKKLYDSLKKEYVLSLDGAEITVANAAGMSNKLLQMANGAIYDDEHGVRTIHDRKLDALEDIIEQSNGKPVLVAYWFKHDLKRIGDRLNAMHVEWSPIEKNDDIDRWNAGELCVGLIHPASAGHGLNLQYGGNHLVWFGLTWSLELYQQTNARLWRQGQNERTVVIQHIVADGTIDRQVLAALGRKDQIREALVEAVKTNLTEHETMPTF